MDFKFVLFLLAFFLFLMSEATESKAAATFNFITSFRSSVEIDSFVHLLELFDGNILTENYTVSVHMNKCLKSHFYLM